VNKEKGSMILCMIAAIYIAVIPETPISAIFWILYAAGALLGILYLREKGERSLLWNYVIWFILDIYAIVRLISCI